MRHISDGKQVSLLLVTALVVAYVRHFLETGEYYWTQFSWLFASWLIHLPALGFFVVLPAAMLIALTKNFFFGDHDEITTDEIFFFTLITIIATAIGVFLFMHMDGVGTGDYNPY